MFKVCIYLKFESDSKIIKTANPPHPYIFILGRPLLYMGLTGVC